MKALREDGTEVKPGDTVVDFRGGRCIFVQAERETTECRDGKVSVKASVEAKPFTYYARVFNLRVTDGR